MPSFDQNLLVQRRGIWSDKSRDSTLSHDENPESLSRLGLIRYRDVAPGPTDRNYDS